MPRRKDCSRILLRLLWIVTVLALVAPITARATTAPAQTQTPPQVSYTSFDNVEYLLYAYVGRNVALLVPSPDLDETVLGAILSTLDNVYDYYARTTGRTPILHSQYQGRGTVAVVPSTCGYGCGYLGYTGIELLDAAFDLLYTGVRDRNEYDQVVFYEFGRNFWFYGDKIEYRGADATGAITTGYAVFMRFMAMEATGVIPGPYNGRDFAYFKSEVIGMLDRYLADEAYTWETTLRVGAAPPNPLGLGASDLFASFLFDLRSSYGDDFVDRIWREVEQRPAATTTQDSVDNFILAACAAAGQNIANLFIYYYGWPMSASAQSGSCSASTTPSSPSNLRVSETTLTSITIEWNDNSNDETGFRIYKWNGADFADFAIVGANVTRFTHSGLGCDVSDFYKVSAYNGAAESEQIGWVEGRTEACVAFSSFTYLPLVVSTESGTIPPLPSTPREGQ